MVSFLEHAIHFVTPFVRKQSIANKYEIMSIELTIPPLVLLKSIKNGTPLRVPVKTVIASYAVALRAADLQLLRAGTPAVEPLVPDHLLEYDLVRQYTLTVYHDGTIEIGEELLPEFPDFMLYYI